MQKGMVELKKYSAEWVSQENVSGAGLGAAVNPREID
jgi:hypothetical protein